MTYASHQEAASLALHHLLARTHTELDNETAGTVLECREHALVALGERLTFLGGADVSQTVQWLRVDYASRRPYQQLSQLLESMPRTGSTSTPPSELLPGPPARTASSPIDQWRSVGRDLMLGNAELTRSEKQPWRTRDEVAWYLVADLATTLEAIVVLDDHLVREGELPATARHQAMAKRLVAGDVAKVARWFGTDNAADIATASSLTQVGLQDGPRIQMVRRPEDYAAAQRALAAFLRNSRADEASVTSGERPGLLAARAVAIGQMRLAAAFASWADGEPGGSLLPGEFLARASAFHSLHSSTARLTEVSQRRSPLVVAQQSEMVMQLRSMTRARPTRESLLDINEATHELTVAVGKALRREGMQRKNIVLLDASGPGWPRSRVITNTRDPFHVACKALANDPAPVKPRGLWAAPIHRERLRTTLDGFAPTGTATPRRLAPSRSPSSTQSRRRDPGSTQGSERTR